MIKLLDSLPIFIGYGESKNEARKAVSKLAYNYLKEKDMLFTIKDENISSLSDGNNFLQIVGNFSSNYLGYLKATNLNDDIEIKTDVNLDNPLRICCVITSSTTSHSMVIGCLSL